MRNKGGKDGIFANADFINFLIKQNALVQNEEGTFILYFDGETVTHAGILENHRVKSKWGIGNLYEHEIWEVPKQYGNDYKRFEKNDEELVIKCFEEFATVIIKGV